MSSDFNDFYGQLYRSETGEKLRPFPYQICFAEQLISDNPPNCLGVPTGCGKESTAIAAFLWQWQTVKYWRRLAYSLPTRALVDQVFRNTEDAIANAGLNVGVSVLKGGAVDRDWVEQPEKPQILIGTQDQLLSRALNRGYTLSPYRWPIEFGLLSQDTLWIFDETQLMGAGFDTSIQLQGLRERFPEFKSTHSIWLSATLDESRLGSVDYEKPLRAVRLGEADRQLPLLQRRLTARKALRPWESPAKGAWEKLAEDAIAAADGGKVLIVVNQVKRAQEIARSLDRSNVPYKLVHSRFRECDRPDIEVLKEFEGIVVATQAIEAGVDLSAKTLFSELCPWPSFVQRVGRCNRRGEFEDAAVYWIDVKDKDALPYDSAELQICRAVLESADEIGIEAIADLQTRHDIQPKREITPVPRRKDLLELFHTDEDLQGSHTDVSVFVRGLKDEDVQLAWREFEDQADRDRDRGQLRREELCRVRIGAAKAFLKEKKAYIWSWTRNEYNEARTIVPGMTILLPCSAGGYSPKFGFTGNGKDKPGDLRLEVIPHESFDDDNLSQQSRWVTLRQHSEDVAAQCEELAKLLPEDLRSQFVTAGRWHDYGKAHDEWQCAIARPEDIYAKVPKGEWKGVQRRGIRHELASMLAARNQGESRLVQYLILCHHGKVRTCIEPGSKEERLIRGIDKDDRIDNEVNLGGGLVIPPQTFEVLDEVAYWSGDWIDDVETLLEEYGPFALAYLEALLRMADWRASKMSQGEENDETA